MRQRDLHIQTRDSPHNGGPHVRINTGDALKAMMHYACTSHVSPLIIDSNLNPTTIYLHPKTRHADCQAGGMGKSISLTPSQKPLAFSPRTLNAPRKVHKHAEALEERADGPKML